MTTPYAVSDDDGWVYEVGEIGSPLSAISPPPGKHVDTIASSVLPAQPYAGTRLKLVSGELVWADARTLASAKTLKIEEVRAAARVQDQSAITVSAQTFAADDTQRALLAQQVVLGREAIEDSIAWDLDWVMTNGGTTTLTFATLKALVRAIDARRVSIAAALAALEGDINAAATIGAVDAFAWVDV